MNATTHTFEGANPYRVVAMRPGVGPAAAVLGQAFLDGLTARTDPRRRDFYTAEIDGVSYYFHVFPKRSVAYLLWSELPEVAVAPQAARPNLAACPVC
jgi:hypothetical protein